jgi:hypothetical protein
VTDIEVRQSEDAADATLQKFSQRLVEVLPEFVPD